MKVLIAEDDLLFQRLLAGVLTRWRYEPVTVNDGKSAIQRLEAGDGPRLAILDWNMPGASGIDVVRHVRNSGHSQYIYLILMTANTGSTDLLTALESGADDYVTKPLHFEELKLRLRSGCRVLEAEERHRFFAETASDGVMTLSEDRAIQFANAAAARIFGKEVLIGDRFDEYIPNFVEKLRNVAVRAGLEPGHLRSWAPLEVVGKDQSGHEKVLEMALSESLDVLQKRVITAVIRDITERKLVERQHAQAQKLESIGQLAAGIAHEINTPIQYVGDNGMFLKQAFRDLLAVIDAGSGGVSESTGAVDLDYLRREVPLAIEQLLQGVDHVARIVRAMKEFSHPGSSEKALCDINRAIESVTVVSRNEWKYVADLLFQLDEDLPPVPCILGEFNQVMLNLIINAAHAIGDIKRETGVKGTINIQTRRKGEEVEILVSDTGTGIPEPVQSRIFDPFFTTKEVGRGTGQGLAIAHSVVVQKHQGTIRFETAVGQGTTFYVTLPLGNSTVPGELSFEAVH